LLMIMYGAQRWEAKGKSRVTAHTEAKT